MTQSRPGWRVSYQRCAEYEILKCSHLLDPATDLLLEGGARQGSRRLVVVDENIHSLHGLEIRAYFDAHDIEARIVSLPGGEGSKSVEAYLWLLHQLDAFPIHRRDEPIIGIGGGVLTDIVGFVASTYRRGVPHIKVPTTLLAYIDAAVGVKTALNFGGHKNRVGTFEAPLLVLLDAGFLWSLPNRHILNGVCEMVKLAVIADRGLFELLELHGAACVEDRFQTPTGGAILDRAVSGMVEELRPNLFEENLARTMDFGHTFIYGLETLPNCSLLHGEAVLLDVLLSANIAANRGLLPQEELNRVLALCMRLGLPMDCRYLEPALLWSSLEERTLHRNGWQRIPLPNGLGKSVFVNDVTPSEIEIACGRTQRALAE